MYTYLYTQMCVGSHAHGHIGCNQFMGRLMRVPLVSFLMTTDTIFPSSDLKTGLSTSVESPFFLLEVITLPAVGNTFSVSMYMRGINRQVLESNLDQKWYFWRFSHHH
jgi:hypothetical protein